MTTTVIDSTVSPVSSTEKLTTATGSPVEITTLAEQVPAVSAPSKPRFDFNAVHNGEACIESLDPKDKGTERQFRFTRALLCTLLGVKSEDTITNHVDKFLKRGVIDNTKNLVLLKSEHGRETTLYDLTVFNYLVMRLDTDQAWAMKAKFNDVLVKHETQTQTQFVLPKTLPEALRLYAAEIEAKEKALQERDEAIRTKTQYQSNLASQMSGRVGGHDPPFSSFIQNLTNG